MRCFITRNPPRPLLVLSNKVCVALLFFIFVITAGSIMLVDLSSRKCIAELCAPQSIHEVEVVQKDDTTDVLLTSFTGAQWIIPLENGGRSLTEVLTACIPSEFRKIEPSSSHLGLCTDGVTVLDSVGCSVELHTSFTTVGGVPKKRYKVALSAVRLEFSIIKGACEWRPLGFVSLSLRPARLPSCLLISERGLIRIVQSPSCPLENVAAEFLFRVPSFCLPTIQQVAKACSIDGSQLKRSVIPTLLLARRGKTLSPTDFSHLLFMAKTVEISMENLVDLFATYQQEEQLLPELLRVVEADNRSPLRKRVVELYVRKSEGVAGNSSDEPYRKSDGRLGIDNELSAFLSRHADLDQGAKSCAEAQLWRSATLLASRQKTNQADVLRVLVRNGARFWSTAAPSARSLMMTCASNLDWSELTEQEVGVLVSHLCEWQAVLNSIAHHETCLRLSTKYSAMFPKHCSILYLISAMYIISDKAAWTQENDAPCRSISCGVNGSAAITSDGDLVVWGDFTNQQNRPFESSGLALSLFSLLSTCFGLLLYNLFLGYYNIIFE
ncbi:hypothetical protein ANCDUO_01183 [Ancylostoma duodenale]|uniref:Uncharacterized protein n=1 Tax=Ancylostoma duodenale TaxID=51022 RepID=A0A0C2HA05_9BILA|nr:hypothetical protein ANCDUO_01183 [Ancylostoma duodenale]